MPAGVQREPRAQRAICWAMASTSEAERRAQLIACAEAVAKLAKHREIEAVHVRLVRADL